MPKLSRHHAAAVLNRLVVHTREDGETTKLRCHAARLEGGEGGVQRVFVWQVVSGQLVSRKLVWR